MRRLFGMAGLLILAACAGHDPDLPPPDPRGSWRIIGLTDATSTSDCIGKPISPICAIETNIACLLRQDSELCRIGSAIIEGLIFQGLPINQPRGYYKLHIWSANRLREEVIPPWRKQKCVASLAGGDIAVELSWLRCPGFRADDCRHDDREDRFTDQPGLNPFTFVVRGSGSNWRVVTRIPAVGHRPIWTGQCWE